MPYIIQYMLKNGIIKSRNNSYSSLMLLVRKKESTLRCMDYRVFNVIVSPDFLHIPIIDELYDNLNRHLYLLGAINGHACPV